LGRGVECIAPDLSGHRNTAVTEEIRVLLVTFGSGIYLFGASRCSNLWHVGIVDVDKAAQRVEEALGVRIRHCKRMVVFFSSGKKLFSCVGRLIEGFLALCAFHVGDLGILGLQFRGQARGQGGALSLPVEG